MRKFLRSLLLIAFCKSILFLSYGGTLQNEGFSAKIFAEHVKCFGLKQGSLDLVVSGGTAPYSYNWSTGATSEDISELPAGSYSVTVTDADGLTTTACIDIVQPQPLKAEVDATESVCSDEKGEATVSVNGGTAPYSYSWSNEGSGSSQSDLPAGSYSVTVADANGCTVPLDFEIAEGGNFTTSTNATDVKCFGNYTGTATVSVSGTSSYTYEWSNGATTASIENIPAGKYFVTVTDEAGCTKPDSAVVSQPEDIVVQTDPSVIPCSGGAIDATVSGGVAPYNYYWSTGSRAEDVSKLQNGFYFLRVSDGNGCMKSTSETISGFNPISLTHSASPASCNKENDGSVNLSVTGGAAPYSFSWSNNATTEDISQLSPGLYSVTVTDANNCSDSLTINVAKDDPFKFQINQENISCIGEMDGSIELVPETDKDLTYSWSNGDTGPMTSSLAPGDYSVTVTSPEGCTKDFYFTIEDAPALELSLAKSEDICKGGSLDLSVTGGTTPYSYSWTNGENIEDINLLNPGSYKVVVTDKNGCQDSAQAVVEGRTITKVAATSGNISCAQEQDGTAKVTIQGTNSPYSISWSNNQTTEEIQNLPKGTYTVTVTDNMGCSFTASTTVSEPTPVSVTLLASSPSCSDSEDGAIRSLVRGGTAPYSYDWSTEGTTSILTGVKKGTYSLTVTDKNGCTGTNSKDIEAPEAISANIVSDNSCEGGTADITVSGGQAPYSYLWSDNSTAADRADLSAGPYSVTITDSKECSETFATTVPEYSPVKASVTVNDATANAVPSGGVAPYTFVWSEGQTTQSVSNLSEGAYSVIVTDFKGCSDTAKFEIESVSTEPLSATIDCCQDQDICKGEKTSIPVHFTGEGPFTFSYFEGSQLRSVTTSDNPYYIETTLYSTTTFRLNSISNGCSNGKICGQATVGVNDCKDKCSFNCFSSEVTQVVDFGDCREVTMEIVNNGNCRNGLSHLSVSIPCGKVKGVSNSRGFKTEVGTDPTSDIDGFKIDNIKNFGEAKDGKAERFYVTYKVCKESGECFGEFCPPLLAFKAANCVFYTKATYVPNQGTLTNTDSKMSVTGLNIYPNPASPASVVKLQLPNVETGQAEITLVNSKGQYVLSGTEEVRNSEINLKLPVVQSGVYMVLVRQNGKQYSQKISIR